MKIVAIKEMSDGNAVVGDMWKDTKIFEGTSTLEEVMRWARIGCQNVKRNAILSLPDGETLEFKP